MNEQHNEQTPLIKDENPRPNTVFGGPYQSLSDSESPEIHEHNNAGGGTSPSTSTRPSAPSAVLFQGRLLILGVAILYGSLNVGLRLVYQRPGPPSASALSAARGWLATLCFLPFLTTRPASSREVPSGSGENGPASFKSSSFWWVAVELAMYNFGAQGFLNLGLLSVESARAAFLFQTSVVMTPVLTALTGQNVKFRVWIGCIITLMGLVLLSSSSTLAASGSPFSGSLLCLCGAFSWSVYLFRLSAVGGSYDEIQMQAAKTLLMGIFYTVWFLIAQSQSDVSLWPGVSDLVSWALLFYTAIGPGALADIIQQKGQSTVSAAEANVLLSLEPVCTTILGLVFLGEMMSARELSGGGLIILASVVATN